MALEAVGLLGVATLALMRSSQPDVPGTFAVGLALFLALFAVALGLAVLSLLRGGRFGVGYGITWQLFQALVGARLLVGGMYLIGAAALLCAIAVFVLLLGLVQATPTPLDQD